MSSTFVLTRSPFILGQINLASFVPDISQPHEDAECPYTVEESDFFVQPDDNFEGVMNTSSATFFKILVTRFVGAFTRRQVGEKVYITAKAGKIYSLKKPASLFLTIMADAQMGTKMKEWLELCHMTKASPRFVTGIRTFTNAKSIHGEHKSSGTGANSTLPVGSLAGDATGSTDLSFSAGHKSITENHSIMDSPGERIFAISYRKVKIGLKKKDLAVTLNPKTEWKPIHGGRGSDTDDGSYFEVDISEDDNEHGCEVFDVESNAGNPLSHARIGVLHSEVAKG